MLDGVPSEVTTVVDRDVMYREYVRIQRETDPHHHDHDMLQDCPLKNGLF